MAPSGRDIEESNTERRAEILGLHYLDVRTLARRPIYKDLIELETMRVSRVVPIVSSKDGLTIGITTITPSDVMDDLRRIHNHQRVRYVLVSSSAFRSYLELYDPPPPAIYENIKLEKADRPDVIAAMSRALANVRAEDMLAYVVDQAFRLQVSDIHCENGADKVRLRMRVHGTLHPVMELDKAQYRILVGAIASAANISTSARDAQTGHIGQAHSMADGSKVVMNMRVETIPAMHGMDIVMRFFSFDEERLQLSKLGFDRQQIKAMNEIIQYPRGLVLVVGPTGSGKTTTLYSLIRELRSPHSKIITLEDPVEFQIEGITQIPIDSHKGASFAKGLRAVLRLDPDVVMLGEIRDEDTIQTALQAALTGHLVMSTYHAASTSLALASIMQIVHRNPLFLNAIRLIQGQRLVRRLDSKTKEAYTPRSSERRQIEQVLASIKAESRPKLPADFKLYRPRLSASNPFGFDGQLAIRELLMPDERLRSFLFRQRDDMDPAKLEIYLSQELGLTTMLQEGMLKVIAGETSLEELYRVGA